VISGPLGFTGRYHGYQWLCFFRSGHFLTLTLLDLGKDQQIDALITRYTDYKMMSSCLQSTNRTPFRIRDELVPPVALIIF